jgi:hypothetical protein
MRRAAKRDDNEALIVTALQSAGWTVVRVSDAGAPDLLVARDGVLTLVEVKGPKGTLTPVQEVAFTKLATAGVLVQVVRSPWEALAAVGASWEKDDLTGHRWFAQNGAYLCLKCWLPEDGLHAKDCPSRTALKPKPKVQSAHRAAKKMEEAMPKVLAEGDASIEEARSVVAAARPYLGVEGELQPFKMKR